MIFDPLFYAAAIPAVILIGLAKGGFSGLGLLSLPLMALVISPVQAAAILLPILIVQDVVSRLGLPRELGPANLAIMLPGACSASCSASSLAAKVSDAAVGARRSASISIVFALRRLSSSGRQRGAEGCQPPIVPAAVLGRGLPASPA